MYKEFKKKNKGITLIALIITIIVLLILAGISIAMVTGENGILSKAVDASEKTNQAEIKEREDLSNLDNFADDVIKNIGGNEGESKGENIYTVNLKVNGKDIGGTVIPVEVEKVIKTEGETEVSEGLTYTYYKNEEIDEAKSSEKKHTFNELEQTESYVLKVRVEDEKNNYGEAEVKVISFSINYNGQSRFLRALPGMTWQEFFDLNYNRSIRFSWGDRTETENYYETYGPAWIAEKDETEDGTVWMNGEVKCIENLSMGYFWSVHLLTESKENVLLASEIIENGYYTFDTTNMDEPYPKN